MKFPKHQYNLLKSIVEAGLGEGHKTFYRHKILKHYSRIMRDYDTSHNDETRGEHISPMMEQIAIELGGKFTKDLNKNGNAKKGTVRIEF